MESVIVLRRGLRTLVNSISYTRHLNFNCEGSKVYFPSDNVSSHEPPKVVVFENALVKMSGSVANIFHVAQVT